MMARQALATRSVAGSTAPVAGSAVPTARSTAPVAGSAIPAARSTMLVAMLAAALGSAGCVGTLDDSDDPRCTLSVSYAPDPLVASLTQPVRATARISGTFDGVATYAWKVQHGDETLPSSPANPDSSQIEFAVTDAGIYRVTVAVPGCSPYDEAVNVLQPDAAARSFRLHITPPPTSSLPAQDRELIIPSGSDFAVGQMLLEPMLQRFGTVRVGSAPVPAYLRFSTAGGSGTVVAESVAGSDGGFNVAVNNVPHDVLVVPTGGQAPFRFTGWAPATAEITGPAGRALTGTVRDPDNQPLVGARVTVKRGGVPSTVGVTGGDGGFTLLLQDGSGDAALSIVPPEGSGLPRLDGTAAQLPPAGQALAITYRGDLALRDVAGLELRRQGAAAPGAQVIFVGELAAAGSASGGVSLTGAVRIAMTAGGDGKLPAGRVPAAALSAVLVPAPGEQAVLPFNSAAPPASLDAPAMGAVTGTAKTAAGAAAAGAVIDLLPSGALARAGVAGRTAVAGAGGAFAVPAAPGGSYLAELSDPQRRGAPRLTPVAAPGAIGSLALAPGHQLTASLKPRFGASPVAGAAVELYCVVCSAEAARRPLATAITAFDGALELLVPDEVPGLQAE